MLPDLPAADPVAADVSAAGLPFSALMLGEPDPDADQVLLRAGAAVILRAEHPVPQSATGLVVVVDPAGGLPGRALLGAVRGVLAGHGVAQQSWTVGTRPVTDTLKIVDDGTRALLGTADREAHVWITGPLVGPLAELADRSALPELGPGRPTLAGVVGALLAGGAQVRSLPL
jgi:hypothetical protein